MSNSQEQSLDEDVVFQPVDVSSPEFLHCERERRAVERLLVGGPASFYGALGQESLGPFLSPQEVGQISGWARDYRASKVILENGEEEDGEDEEEEEEGEGGGGGGGGVQGFSDRYFPTHSDTPAPLLTLGWPERVSWVGRVRAAVHTSPPAEGQPPLREVIRRLLRGATKVIAIATDKLTDSAVTYDLLQMASQGVPVYIILNQRSVQDNFTPNRLSHPNIQVRVLGGKSFCSREGRTVVGEMRDSFLLVDLETVVQGSYSLTWSDAHLHRQLVTVLSGPVVESFDREFRILFAASLPLPKTGRVERPAVEAGHHPELSDLGQPRHLPPEPFISPPSPPSPRSPLDWEALGVVHRDRQTMDTPVNPYARPRTPDASVNQYTHPRTPDASSNQYTRPRTPDASSNQYTRPRTPDTPINQYTHPRTPDASINQYTHPRTPDTPFSSHTRPRTPDASVNQYTHPRTPDTPFNPHIRPRTPDASINQYTHPRTKDTPLDRHAHRQTPDTPFDAHARSKTPEKTTTAAKEFDRRKSAALDERRTCVNPNFVAKNQRDNQASLRNMQHFETDLQRSTEREIQNRVQSKTERGYFRQLANQRSSEPDDTATSQAAQDGAKTSSGQEPRQSRDRPIGREDFLEGELPSDGASSSRRPLILRVPQTDSFSSLSDILKRLQPRQSPAPQVQRGTRTTVSELSRSMMDLSTHHDDTGQGRDPRVPRLQASYFDARMTPALALIRKRSDVMKSELLRQPKSFIPPPRPRSSSFALQRDWRRPQTGQDRQREEAQ